MNDIIISGINLDQLEKQRKEVQKGATKWISNALNELSVILDKFEDEDFTLEQAEQVAPHIKEVLENIDRVSSATGVEYEFEWCGVDEPFYRVDDMSYSDYYVKYPNLKALSNKLDDVRYQQSVWNGSACY